LIPIEKGNIMSRKFYAVDRETGARWTPRERKYEKQYLVMYDSGYLAVVTEHEEGAHIEPLNPKVWRKVMQGEEVVKPN
jgi:hypothetical protein